MKEIRITVDFCIKKQMSYTSNKDIIVEVEDDFNIKSMSDSAIESFIKKEIEYLDIENEHFDEEYEDISINSFKIKGEDSKDKLTPKECLRCEMIENICQNCIKKKEGLCKGL